MTAIRSRPRADGPEVPKPVTRRRQRHRETAVGVRVSRTSRALTLGVLILAVVYFLVPVWWLVISTTKSNQALISSNGFWFSGWALWHNLREIFSFNGTYYARWLLNSAIYALVGGVGATLLGTACGYALAKLQFRGRSVVFAMIMSGVLLPGALLTVPLYLMFSKVHLTNSYWAVIIPSLVSPFAVYLARVFAADSVPDEVLEAARIDGAGELRIFFSIVLRLMSPALATIFLFTFVGVWNNFFLALVMLSNENLYPVTLGLFTWFSEKNQTTYNVVLTGSLISVIPLIAAFILLSRYWRNGISAGAVKG